MSVSLRRHKAGQAHDDAAKQFTLLLGRRRTSSGPAKSPVRAGHLPDQDVLAALRKMRGRGRNDFRCRPCGGRSSPASCCSIPPPLLCCAKCSAIPLCSNYAASRPCRASPRRSWQVRRSPKTGRMERTAKPSPMRTTAPNAWAFSRFMANVVRLERRAGMISDLAPRLRRELMQAFPTTESTWAPTARPSAATPPAGRSRARAERRTRTPTAASTPTRA